MFTTSPCVRLYSKDVANLLMAGRNASCSHVAFTSTRVMATCAVMGQAVGTAAALCVRRNLSPRQLARDPARLKELQQILLRDDQTIKNLRNEDPDDLARQAKVTASGVYRTGLPERVIDGLVRDRPGEIAHRWMAPLTETGAWLELTWPSPWRLRQVQLTFDTGFQRELTLTAADNHNKNMIRAPQPETVRDYRVLVRTVGGKEVEIARVRGNHQRLRRHTFAAQDAVAVRIVVEATNGAEEARLYEIRCYS